MTLCDIYFCTPPWTSVDCSPNQHSLSTATDRSLESDAKTRNEKTRLQQRAIGTGWQRNSRFPLSDFARELDWLQEVSCHSIRSIAWFSPTRSGHSLEGLLLSARHQTSEHLQTTCSTGNGKHAWMGASESITRSCFLNVLRAQLAALLRKLVAQLLQLKLRSPHISVIDARGYILPASHPVLTRAGFRRPALPAEILNAFVLLSPTWPQHPAKKFHKESCLKQLRQ